MIETIRFIIERRGQLATRVIEHLELTFWSLLLACVIAIPMGVIASRSRAFGTILLAVVGLLQTIPSLALLAVLLVICGAIGTLPAVIALTLYALLPIARNTVTGLSSVPADALEAADALGMTPLQKLKEVELPLAAPTILAGVRTAAVIGVGVATLAAFIGAGGLGQFINRGLSLSDVRLTLLGAIPAAALALVIDGAVATFAWGLTTRSRNSPSQRVLRIVARSFLPVVVAVVLFGSIVRASSRESTPTITIGAKKFSEQYVLGEMIALLVEDRLDVTVERRFTLGGTLVCHEALLSGGIDLYPEYTGTALVAVLDEPLATDRDQVFKTVSDRYRELGLRWLSPFGFDNTYVLTVRADEAARFDWEAISDLKHNAPLLTAGFEPEFVEREDGYHGLKTKHGLEFGRVADMEQSLMYQALAAGDVDVICAYATDGRIDRYRLQPLDDDLGAFPPYECAPVVREQTLRDYPELSNVIAMLGGRLPDQVMRQLNGRVDVDGLSARDVAREFLITHGLLSEADSPSDD